MQLASSCSIRSGILLCLGSNPKSLLRDWDEMQSYGITNDLTPRSNLYIKASNKSNFFLQPTISMAGAFFSNYTYITKYSHDSYISKNETLEATNIWGESGKGTLRCPGLSFKLTLSHRLVTITLYRFLSVLIFFCSSVLRLTSC